RDTTDGPRVVYYWRVSADLKAPVTMARCTGCVPGRTGSCERSQVWNGGRLAPLAELVADPFDHGGRGDTLADLPQWHHDDAQTWADQHTSRCSTRSATATPPARGSCPRSTTTNSEAAEEPAPELLYGPWFDRTGILLPREHHGRRDRWCDRDAPGHPY